MLRKLEKYEIHEELGHGGMATVYRARDTVLDRSVALKVMHPHLRGAEEARKRFHREAQSVARLRHPRVLEIYDFSGEGSEEAYIAAELLTGPTLKRWREDREAIPAEIAACFVIEICRALEAAHEAGIVHRDVKPENVLLHENRTLKLTDFGIADMMDAASMTATGQILGSPGHMAPEQIEGRDTDRRTDIFSLGTVLYFLATGRLPFTGRNPHQILKRIMDGEYVDPLRVSPEIGGRLRAIIARCLEREPDARFQTATELRETLEAFVAEGGIDDPTATLTRYLAAPEVAGPELRARVIERLIARGTAASEAGEVPIALDCYNRVLALDDGNERVLRLIERVGSTRRRRTARVAVLGGLGAALAVGAVASWALVPEDPEDRRPLVPMAGTDAGQDGAVRDSAVVVLDAGATGVASVVDSQAILTDAAIRDAALRDAARATTARRDAGPPPERAVRVRVVRFVSPQANLRIGVDGAAPRPISEFRTTELTVGPPHAIVIEPDAQARDVYQTRTLSVRVPPGEGEHEVPVSLALRDALLVVRSVVPADVSIQGRVSGRANDPLYVPMRLREESLRVIVQAPGYRPVRLLQRLVAGAPTVEVDVALEAEIAP